MDQADMYGGAASIPSQIMVGSVDQKALGQVSCAEPTILIYHLGLV
jgi:hypothetical protein